MYFHCLDTDELWFMLANPQALICFWESTWTVLSYYIKNGRLVTSLLILSLQCIDNKLTSTLCSWLIWHDLWPLASEILVQILGPLLSRVQSMVQSRVQSPDFVLSRSRSSGWALSGSTDRLVVRLSNLFTTACCKLRGALAPVAPPIPIPVTYFTIRNQC